MKTTKLISKTEIARETYLFRVTKPEGYDFIPGQFASWFLRCENGACLEHYFSFTSHPSEDYLEFATRNTKSLYKRSLINLEKGGEIKVSEPLGKFILDRADSPLVFIAGGIGITPIRSMLKELEKNNFSRKVYLFFANRTQADAPFYNEFEKIKNPNFKFIPVHSQETEFVGEEGYLTQEIIEKYLINFKQSKCYVVGPPKMVEAIYKIAKNIFDKDKIIFEEFIGYN